MPAGHGLDMSGEMLAIAKARGAYGKLIKAMLGDAVPLETGSYAAVFSTGVFTEGHAPSESLRELARITRAGGYLIFTVRDSVYEARGFHREIARLLADGWTMIEESPLFRAFAIAEPDVRVKAFVLRRERA